MLDEPTTGLHFDDIAKLMRALRKLLDAGHSLHGDRAQPDVIRARLAHRPGPEGGRRRWRGGGFRHARRRDVARHLPPGAALLCRGDGGGACAAGSATAYRASGKVAPARQFWQPRRALGAVKQIGPGCQPGRSVGRRCHPHRQRRSTTSSPVVDIPRGKFNVITGVSARGKSTLAFDILFNEGQRRYLESSTPTRAASCSRRAARGGRGVRHSAHRGDRTAPARRAQEHRGHHQPRSGTSAPAVRESSAQHCIHDDGPRCSRRRPTASPRNC